jgi:hypothetical protein
VSQTASVAARGERDIQFELTPMPPSAEETRAPAREAEPTGHSPARSIAGYSMIAIGAGLFVAAGVEAANWVSDKNASDTDRGNVPNSVPDVCLYPSAPAQDACQKGKDAKNASILGWVFAGAGAVIAGTGTWLVVSDSAHSEKSGSAATRQALSVHLVPEIGVRTQSLAVRVAF